MTINQIWEDALIYFDEPSGKYTGDGGAFGRRLVNRIYREVCREAKCGTRTNTVLVASTTSREIPLPANLIALKRVLCRPTGWERGFRLERIQETADFDDESKGMPGYYYQVGTTAIGFAPFPDQAYSIPIVCLIGPTMELSGEEIPSLVPADWHYVIAYGVVYKLFCIDKGDDGEGAMKWRGLYGGELAAFKHFLREGSNADAYAGVE